MASPLVVYIVVIMAVSAMSLPEERDDHVCYIKVKSQKIVPISKTRYHQTRRGWSTVYYTENVLQTYYRSSKVCCAGYYESKGTCVPVCDPACSPPKVCVAPNSCRCPNNLVEDGSGQCVERLCLERCQHGRCNPAKSVCVCESGYRWQGDSDTGRCEPMCQPGCGGGGWCSAPNNCTCISGFRKAPSAIGCEPVSCAQGFELKPNGTSGLRTCQPTCASGCPNGTCIAPNKCKCDEGYEPAKIQNGLSTCVAMPRCWVNGYYAERDTCRCLPGYKLMQSEEGLPMCQPDCGSKCGPHAICVAPNTCQCLRGYRDERSIPEIETNVAIRCAPVCRHGCFTGKCVAPNECQCKYYLKFWRTYNCVNASCGVTRTCKCWPNYEEVPGMPKTCRPKCDPPCGNGTCVSPGRCVCSQGYELNSGRCIPKCKTNCGFGTCVAPDRCECWEGFELATDEAGYTKCIPACKPACVHGDCIHPNTCECWRGYKLNDSVCEPVCVQPCKNADCVEPDTCRCWDGYAFIPGDESQSSCEPTCNTTCVNATCTAPNTCTCLEGLVHDNGDPSRATCGLPCPDHLCSEEVRGEDGCLMAGEDQDCVCERGRKRPLCTSEGRGAQESTGGPTTWLLLLLLPPALAAVALLAFLYVRNRRKNAAAGYVPPQRLSTSASEGASPRHSSDEYDDASGYYTAKFPVDTKTLIKRANKHRVPDTKASRRQSNEDPDGLYEGIGGGRSSPIYGEIGTDNPSRDSSDVKSNNAKSAAGTKGGTCFPSQMAENEFYGDSGGTEWSRASLQVTDNDLYTECDKRPERNTFAETDLSEMYAKVVKKGNRSSAKIVDNDFYGQPSRNKQVNAFGKVVENDAPGGIVGQKSMAQEAEGHYEEVSDGFRHRAEPCGIRKEGPAKRDEEQDYEEITDIQPSEVVDNDLYRGSGSAVKTSSARQKVDEDEEDYAEIGNEADRGPAEIVENSLYEQAGGGDGNSNQGTNVTENDLYSTNATDLEKKRYLHAKIMKRKGNKKT